MHKMEIILPVFTIGSYLQHSREESEINSGSTCIQMFYKTDMPIYDL